MNKTSVLITEDESIIAMDLKHTLESLGYRVCHVAATGADAVAAADDYKPEIVLMDIFLDGPMDGIEAAMEIQRRHKLPVVYLTAHSDEATFLRARETRPHGFILKPCGADTLYSTIETALERHRLEQRLRESEELLNETGEMARIGGWKIDLLTDRVRWTRAVRQIIEVPEGFETTIDEAIGFYAPHHRPVVYESLRRAEKDGIPFDLELDVITAKGNHLSVRVTGCPVLENGACTGISGTFQDITELKQARDRSDRTLREQRSVLDSLRELVMLVDDEYRIQWVNAAGLHYAGMDLESLRGRLCYEVWWGMASPCADCPIQELKERDDIRTLEVVARDGKVFELRANRVLNEHGAVTGYLETATDITEKRMTEKALRESEERYRTIVEQSLVGIGISRGDEIVYANRSLLEMLGYDSLEEFAATPLLDHLTPESRLLVRNRMEALAKGEAVPPVFHHDIMRKDGAIRTVELAVSPVIFNGEPCRQSTFIDITARLRAEKDLKEKNRHFSRINLLLQELPSTGTSMEVAELLCERVKEITGAVMVLFNEYDPVRKEVFNRHIAAAPGVMEFVATLYPDGPASIRFPVEEKWKRHILLQQYAKLEGGLHEASFGLMSPEDARNIEHALGIKEVYALSLSWEGELLGALIVMTPHDVETMPFEVMESYARAATATFSSRNAVEKLRETEELFRSLAENSQDYIMRYDPRCSFTYMNPAALKLSGLTEKDIIGKTHREAGFPAELSDLWDEKINRVFETGKPLQHRFEWESVNGPVVLDWRLFPEFDSGGGVQSVLGVSRDITDLIAAETGLRRGEERYRLLLESISDGVFVLDREFRYRIINEASCRLVGMPREKLLGNSLRVLFPGIEKTPFYRVYADVLKTGAPSSVVDEFIHPDGEKGWYEVHVYPVPEGILCVGRDITERMRIHNELRRNEANLSALINNTDDMVWAVDGRYRLIIANTAVMKGLGAALNWQPRIGEPLRHDRIDPSIMALWESYYDRALEGEHFSIETKSLLREEDCYMEYRFSPITDDRGGTNGVVVTGHDITKRKIAENEIKRSLSEKEVLLKEIHHRVKNNFQVVTSLLNIQARGIKDPAMTAALIESRDRIKAMALIHERLYRSGNLAGVDFDTYLRTIVTSLFGTYGKTVRCNEPIFDLEKIVLPVDKAIPCGLIANELISNALKHAFPPDLGYPGTLKISMCIAGKNYRLIVADDGKGFADGMNPRKTDSLGYTLVDLFVKQLSGTMKITKKKGVSVTVEFPVPKNKK